MKVKLLLVVLGLTHIVGLCACSKTVSPEQLPGMYVGQHGNGVEIVYLNGDRSYSRHWTPSGGTDSVSSEKWELQSLEGHPVVALYAFTPHFPQAPSGTVLLGIRKFWGRIRLYRSEDLDQFYSKE